MLYNILTISKGLLPYSVLRFLFISFYRIFLAFHLDFNTFPFYIFIELWETGRRKRDRGIGCN